MVTKSSICIDIGNDSNLSGLRTIDPKLDLAGREFWEKMNQIMILNMRNELENVKQETYSGSRGSDLISTLPNNLVSSDSM